MVDHFCGGSGRRAAFPSALQDFHRHILQLRGRRVRPRLYNVRVSSPKAIGRLSGWVLAFWCATAQATPGATLNRFHPAATSDDVFAISRAKTLGHLGFEAKLSFDYANDPLVYESQTGASDSESVKLVSDQLTLNVGVALGLLESFQVHAAMPLHLVMDGEPLAGTPNATGFGPGDLALGGRAVFLRFGDRGALAAGIDATFPTGEDGERGPAVAGDAGVSLAPALIAEVRVAMLRFTANAGIRFRKDVAVAGEGLDDELVWGVAASTDLMPKRLDAHLLAFGSTSASDVGHRASSPFEALLGAGLRMNEHLHFGLATGMGFSRGYGSPDLRVVASAAYRLPSAEAREARPQTETATKPEEVATDEAKPEPTPIAAAVPATLPPTGDRDHDGVPDTEDACPIVPGPTERRGCSADLEYSPQTGLLAWTSPLQWRRGRAMLEPSAKPLLEALSQALTTHGELTVRVETHVAPQRDASAAQRLSVDRAKALVAWLLRTGIERTRFAAYACGTSRPGVTEEDRTEVYVTSPPPTGEAPSLVGCELLEPSDE
jgi:OmpA-OmpF porin, OOP family